MVFSSLTFLFIFFPIVFIGNRLIPKKYINVFLLIMSLIFYAYGEPKYIILMIISIVVNYFIGIIMEDKISLRKPLLILSILFNIGLLLYFKYFDFFIFIINKLIRGEIPQKNIPLPIGISFYTFQILSYVIDLYNGKYKAQRSIRDLALYISLFPQLIAGPIVRYEDVNSQLSDRQVTTDKTVEGIKRFIYGLAKKVIIANTLADALKDINNIEVYNLPFSVAWVGVIICSLNIYYDFSGYSDMAIGLGKMLGFDFSENFDHPYLSKSITEFWRRWHISLGTWFRKYVYIPLGGNRNGIVRTCINLFIVFALTGLWHGASFGFVIWGIMHGVLIIIERLGFSKFLEKHSIIARIYTLLAVGVGWIIFECGLSRGVQYIKLLFNVRAISAGTIYNFAEVIDSRTVFIMILGIALCGAGQEIIKNIKNRTDKTETGGATDKERVSSMGIKIPESVEYVFCLALMMVSIILLAGNTYNPFIYFRF